MKKFSFLCIIIVGVFMKEVVAQNWSQNMIRESVVGGWIKAADFNNDSIPDPKEKPPTTKTTGFDELESSI